MYISPSELQELAKTRSEVRLSEAEQYRVIKEARGETQTSRFERIQSLAVFIATALLPLGVSLRRPFSDPHPRSLDISTN
jgi:hypothetical protein